MRKKINNGDTGYTSLRGNSRRLKKDWHTDHFGDGLRVAKYDPRISTAGDIDEVIALMGLARSIIKHENTRDTLFQIQKDLSILSNELLLTSSSMKENLHITKGHVEKLEMLIAATEKQLEPSNELIFPGKTTESAILDVVRTVVRRAERNVVSLWHDEIIRNEEAMRYLNRLSDFIYALARLLEKKE